MFFMRSVSVFESSYTAITSELHTSTVFLMRWSCPARTFHTFSNDAALCTTALGHFTCVLVPATSKPWLVAWAAALSLLVH